MKIEKIVIQNLNSIEDAEINFSEGILSKEPLFLICGETGSGKSTILDAITLALYDKASRYESVKNKEKTENGKNDTKDTTNILRKGKNDGKAEVYFSVKNTCYIASWFVHKTKSNTYTTNNRRKLEIVDGELKTVISTNIGVVNKTIEELVGLTYDQFVRSVMLAQGEFNTFLKSKKSEQSEILEMLTGTEVYSKIADAVKNKKGEAFYKKKEIETLCNGLKDKALSPDEISELNLKQDELLQSVYLMDVNLKKIETSIVWYKKNLELQKECDNAKLLYDNVLLNINSQEYKDNQAIVSDYFKTSKERATFKELQRLESELMKINDIIDKNVATFFSLNDSFLKEKENKEKLVLLTKDLALWIDNHKDNEIVSDNLNLILALLDDLSQISNILISKEKELENNKLKKNAILKELQSLSQSYENVKKSKEEAENNLEKLLNDFDSDEYQKLIEEQQKLDSERKHYVDRNAKLNNVRTVLEQYLELNQNLKNEKDKFDNLKLSFNQKNDTLSQIKSSFEAKDFDFQKQKEMVENWAKEYRSKLKDGEPCPVCGSKEHYYKDENLVQSLFASIENEWKKLKDSYENAKDDVNKTETELNLILRNINNEEKRLNLLLKNLNELCNGNVIFDIERIDVNIKRYNDLILNIDNQIIVINDKLKQVALVKKNIDEAQNIKKSIEEKYNSIEKDYSAKQLEYQQIESSINNLETTTKEQKLKYEEKEVAVNQYLKIEGWKQSFFNSPKQFVKIINQIASEWKKNVDTLKNTENQIANIDEVISQCDKIRTLIIKIIPKKEAYRILEVYVLKDLPSLFSAVYEKFKEKLESKSRIEEELISVKKIIRDFIDNNSGFTFERLKCLSEIDDIQFFVQKNKGLDDELIRSKNTLTIKTEELNSHQKDETKPADDVKKEDLELSLISLTNDKKKLEESLSEVKMKLALNSQNHSVYIEYQKDLEEKDRIYHLWEQLAKAIGTTDGDNFRDVAQAYTMGILLDRANYYMEQLSSRYKLANYPDSLAIMVQDKEMGNELRAASSLSGGETFLVSLALALGLTSLNDNHFNMDLLFIDEGFGTLDNESLDMVMNTLENLNSLGRRVGIISHVDTLKERIPAKIQLVRNGKSASKVEIVKN